VERRASGASRARSWSRGWLRRLSACSLAGLGKVFDEQARLVVLSASSSPAEEPSFSLRHVRAWRRPRHIGGSSANSSARPASAPVDHVLPSNVSRVCGASAAELTASRPRNAARSTADLRERRPTLSKPSAGAGGSPWLCVELARDRRVRQLLRFTAVNSAVRSPPLCQSKSAQPLGSPRPAD